MDFIIDCVVGSPIFSISGKFKFAQLANSLYGSLAPCRYPSPFSDFIYSQSLVAVHAPMSETKLGSVRKMPSQMIWMCGPPSNFPSKINFLILVLVLLSLASTVLSLPTELEKRALGQILESFPDLTSVPLWEQNPAVNEFYGRSWRNDFQTLCNSGDGYDYYGVYCENGHIAGLRVFVAT